jgi:SAM-dependent methyltransferase
MQKLTADGSPSFLHIPTSSPVCNALDLGCGYGHWVAHAAQVWGAHGAKIIGVGIPLSFDEDQATLPGVDSENVKLLCHNLYVYVATGPHSGRSANHASQLVSQNDSPFRTTPLIMCV